MKILIRADASLQIGSGHIMRCLTLAHELSRRGHEVRFICRALPGHLGETIERAGFGLVLLPVPPQAGRLPESERCELLRSKSEAQAATCVQVAHAHWLPVSQAQDAADCVPPIRAFAPDWIICDHYALSADWELAAKAATGCRLMAIDDLADRPHAADLLLDQNLGHTPADYAGLVPPACRLLTGTRYALLREEFAAWREASLQRRAAQAETGYLKHILVNLGGVDKDNHTLAVLQALSGSLPAACSITVVMGKTAVSLARVGGRQQYGRADGRSRFGHRRGGQHFVGTLLLGIAHHDAGVGGKPAWYRRNLATGRGCERGQYGGFARQLGPPAGRNACPAGRTKPPCRRAV